MTYLKKKAICFMTLTKVTKYDKIFVKLKPTFCSFVFKKKKKTV